jgi:nucleotide-binding universal stress UspA family protein
MKDTTTLFIITVATPDAVISELAEACAKDRIHLSCLILGLMPELPFYAYSAMPYGGMAIPDNWTQQFHDARQAQTKRVEEVETLLAKSGTFAHVDALLCATSDIRHAVAQRARVSDMVYLAPDLRDASDLMREAAHGVLFLSPIGLMLNASPSITPKRVFVAWDSSQAASEAIHVALPYLKGAQEVVIGCFDPVTVQDADGADPGTDLAAWLSHHGCKVTLSQYPSGGREIGQCIQDRARETGAELVVLGAYGHSRMLEAVLGGTTRVMMDQDFLPVLLAH